MSSGRGGGRGGRGGNRHDSQPRTVLVSKALSRLLRHAAVQERIPIDNHGYVRVDHLLGWQRLRSMKPPVTFDEVVQVVQENEKKRFALKYVADGSNPSENESDVPTTTAATEEASVPTTEQPTDTEGEAETETQRAISKLEALKIADNGINPKKFFIRATQGHSMKAVEAENLLTPITLDDEASIPDAVVHGTFYGAWDSILTSGGLKPMSRNHVHFATGPSLEEVLQQTAAPAAGGETTTPTTTKGGGGGLGSILGKNKVISGMRSDAQILVYVDIRRALIEEQETMKWWRSENGVILTEGVGEEKEDKIVPTKYFLAAVEIKEGIGKLWEDGKVVKELPENLRNRALPRGKGGAGGQRGRGRGGGRGS